MPTGVNEELKISDKSVVFDDDRTIHDIISSILNGTEGSLNAQQLEAYLSNYYNKTETYTKEEIADKLAELDITDKLADYITEAQLEGQISNFYTKDEVVAVIVDKISQLEKATYKFADSKPTSTKVMINGLEEDVEEGVKYLVKDAETGMVDEYIVINGEVFETKGSTEVNLEGYATENYVNNKIGQLNQLVTKAKSNIVSAINEVADVHIRDLEKAIDDAIIEAQDTVATLHRNYQSDLADLKSQTAAELDAFELEKEEEVDQYLADMLAEVDDFKDRQLQAFVEWFQDKRNLLNDANAGEILNRIDDNYLLDFKRHYGLIDSVTTITEDDDGKHIVIETAEATVTTTIVESSDGTKTITDEVVPTFGLHNYTKTTVITEVEGVKTITETVEKVGK